MRSPLVSGRLPMRPLSVWIDLFSESGRRCSIRLLINSVVVRKNTGARQSIFKSGLIAGFKATATVNKSNTNATAEGSVDTNRNGKTAPTMSRAQNFNDPPYQI